MSQPVTIIGAGLAGLSCARELKAHGVQSVILEASDHVGGRVRTDEFEGFLLDRGFQVLLTAYPECRRLLDYGALKLKAFYPGALVRFDGAFYKLADPWRHPLEAVASIASPIGSFTDKLRVASVRTSVTRVPLEELFARLETTTAQALSAYHFSHKMVDRFFRPFLGGIFLERDLVTSSRMFEFVFRMFSEGDTALPAHGMQAIPKLLGHELDVRLNTKVEQLPASLTVVAVEEPEAARLLGEAAPVGAKSVDCLYYAAEKAPVSEPILMLNGDGSGPINNCSVVSAVAPTYAPAGASLISVTVLQRAHEPDVRSQLTQWFGDKVARWQHLRTYSISYAQPAQLFYKPKPVLVRPGLYRCGDYAENASIDGALASGRRAAQALLKDQQLI
jgi:phytoene dehydrogenase-like protein